MGLHDVLGGAWRLLWGSLGVLELFLSSLGGRQGIIGGLLGVLGRSFGGSLGDPVGDQVRQTLRTRMFQRFVCFHVFLFIFGCFCDILLFCFVFVLAMGVWELFLGSLAGPQGIPEGFLGSLGGPRKFLGGSG